MSEETRLNLRGRDDPWLYAVARALLVPLVRLYGRVSFEGAGNLPAAGPAIVVANHPSDVDPVLIGVMFPRHLHFMADIVQFRRGFVGPVIRRLGAFPIHKGRADREALEMALALLNDGKVVTLFGEGDMFHRSDPAPFHTGVAFLAVHSGAPVVPVAIAGAERLWRDGRLHRPRITVVAGAPRRFAGLRRSRGAYQRVADDVHATVVGLADRATSGGGPGRVPQTWPPWVHPQAAGRQRKRARG
jgi:1-acyl-sn-glycerol-3-phosphate acyltransferase